MLFTDERHDACGNDEEAVSGDAAKSWRMKVREGRHNLQ